MRHPLCGWNRSSLHTPITLCCSMIMIARLDIQRIAHGSILGLALVCFMQSSVVAAFSPAFFLSTTTTTTHHVVHQKKCTVRRPFLHPLRPSFLLATSVEEDGSQTYAAALQQYQQTEQPQQQQTDGSGDQQEHKKILYSSSFLGDLYQLVPPAGDNDNDKTSFVAAMGVPTFAAVSGSTTTAFLQQQQQQQPSSSSSSCLSPTTTSTRTRARGLEGALGPDTGPALVVDGVLTHTECHDLVQAVDALGFGAYQSGKNHHGALQLVVSHATTQALLPRLGRHVDLDQVDARRRDMEQYITNAAAATVDATGTLPEQEEDVRLELAGLNPRWRVYKYAPGGEERFAPHIDAGFPPSGLSDDGNELVWDTTAGQQDTEEVVSRLTILFYLNEDFVGGETKFYQPVSQQQQLPRANGNDDHEDDASFAPPVLASVRPVTGSCLIFPQGVGQAAVDHARLHWPLHEGSPVLSGSPKYVIRSDILFRAQRQTLPLQDPMFCHDHLVRKAFLPQSSSFLSSPVWNANYLSQVASLYNPHMGVENMGPFLYSFLRLTKKKRIVEIGAGYTSPWILQALADNDDEMKRIRILQQEGACRLLDYEWTNAKVVQDFDEEPAQLLCIDNCEHQKETATGAMAIANSLGLDGYMQFFKGDAFCMNLAPDSVDVLWCDFGVGSRMRDFVAQAWSSLRPGGFLLCHSTLTNLRTRDWLEAARSRQSEEVTGIPPDEYVEVSLLEPHKHYQNSISIFQKRKGYREPVYSEYA